MYDYDEVYAYLSEKHFENIESLMIDIENDQLLGEDAFAFDFLVKKMNRNIETQKLKTRTEKIRNPIRI